MMIISCSLTSTTRLCTPVTLPGISAAVSASSSVVLRDTTPPTPAAGGGEEALPPPRRGCSDPFQGASGSPTFLPQPSFPLFHECAWNCFDLLISSLWYSHQSESDSIHPSPSSNPPCRYVHSPSIKLCPAPVTVSFVANWYRILIILKAVLNLP